MTIRCMVCRAFHDTEAGHVRGTWPIREALLGGSFGITPCPHCGGLFAQNIVATPVEVAGRVE